MTPYRMSAAPQEVPPPSGFKQWWRCYILKRHIWSDCLITCAFFECQHKKCVYCGHVDPRRHLPEDKPHTRDLFGTLAWGIGCAHEWKTVPLTTYAHLRPTQQCIYCPNTRPQKFPEKKPCEHDWSPSIWAATGKKDEACRRCGEARSEVEGEPA